MKTKNKRNHSNQTGITLIALVVTIVVLLILAGVSINALFGDSGIINKAKDAQNKMDQAAENDQKGINELSNWLDSKINGNSGGNTTGGNTTGGDANPSTTPKISTLVGKVVDKNTKAEDTYGNKITIPKGFKVLAHGTEAGSATYTYSGDTIPAVQDGIVIEDTQTETAGNQFVWVPVGTINNKTGDSKGATSTITLGRYSDFTAKDGIYIPTQNAEDYTQEVLIDTDYKELNIFREGTKSENATARDLKTFIETSLANGGYYIARYEASKNTTTNKIESKYDKTVLKNITQPNAAKIAREMYGEVKENDKLVYASDLVNSYAWDTAIIFIQTYSTGTDASSYASKNKSTSFAKTGINPDKYCNICDMSGNVDESTTETSINTSFYYVRRGGDYYNTGDYDKASGYTSFRHNQWAGGTGLRPLLYLN